MFKSESKHKKQPTKLQTTAAKQMTSDSNSKSKLKQTVDNKKKVGNQIIAKNLLIQFNELSQPKTSLKQQYKSESVKSLSQQHIESLNESSNLNDISAESIINEKASIKQNEKHYGYQLPQSYILALTGLQEAIKMRDGQIKKLKKIVKEQKQMHLNCDKIIEEYGDRQKQFEQKIRELNLQIKFLKETIFDFKENNNNLVKSKAIQQNQLISLKEITNQEISNHKNQLKIAEEQIKNLNGDVQKLQIQLADKITELNNRKRQISEILMKEGEQRAKAKIQIQSLKQQILVLNDRLTFQQLKNKQHTLLNQKAKLDSIEAELALNKQILKDVTLQANIIDRPRSQTIVKQINYNQIPSDYNINSNHKIYRQSQQKPAFKMQRSSSHMKFSRQSQNRSDRKQMISQFRQLMRKQKQLVGLNYQFQLLEKQMINQTDPIRRSQTQKNYIRMKRQIQRKECETKQLKDFLNDPLSK